MKKVPADKRWYLKIIPSGSNQEVAEILGSDVAIKEEIEVECDDGIRRLLWEVEYSVVERAMDSLNSGEYEIWRSVIKGEKPRKIRKQDLVPTVDIPDARPRVLKRP